MNPHHKFDEKDKNNEGLGIRLLEFAVRLMVPERVREEFVGDLLEEWSSSVVPRVGKPRAFVWLCSQLLRSVVPMARVWVRGFFFGDNAMFHRQNVPVYAGSFLTLISVVVLYLLMLFIVPIEATIHSVDGIEFQYHERLIIDISNHTAQYWYCWAVGAIVLAGGLRLVESKWKSEHKARIHTVLRTVLGLTACFGTVCTTSMVVSFWSTIQRVTPF